jgi:sugar phosphate isomerase/epimerase
MSVELGIFARIFPRASADAVAAAVAGAGFGTTQLNLSSMGLPTLPPVGAALDLTAVGAAFSAHEVSVWGLSGTFNMAHPDASTRHLATARAQALIEVSPGVGAGFVTLCTGSRDAQDMWRRHPDNSSAAAWRDMRASLDLLLSSAQSAGVRLGVEPEPGNVVSGALQALRLLDELGADAGLIGIVLDPANLVDPAAVGQQGQILRAAFAELGPYTVALHAKDVVDGGGFAAAGTGWLDYGLIFELHAALPVPVPVIIQDAVEDDVARTREFLLSQAGPGPGRHG